MKKNLKLIVFTVVLCAVSALNVKVVLDTEHSSDLAMTSLAAIGEGNSGESKPGEGNSGEGGSSEGGSGEGGGISDWWNRKDYVCVSVTCLIHLVEKKSNIAKNVGDGLGTVAHSWDCTGCAGWGYSED